MAKKHPIFDPDSPYNQMRALAPSEERITGNFFCLLERQARRQEKDWNQLAGELEVCDITKGLRTCCTARVVEGGIVVEFSTIDPSPAVPLEVRFYLIHGVGSVRLCDEPDMMNDLYDVLRERQPTGCAQEVLSPQNRTIRIPLDVPVSQKSILALILCPAGE